MSGKEKIAVIIPCYNEEASVKKVVDDFKRTLPEADIYVFDNASSDRTADIARKAGAIVRYVGQKGKGNVVRRMFVDVDADVYIMVDGDATYHAPSAKNMVDMLLKDHLDMVVGCRKEESVDNNNYRPGHRMGNKLLMGTVMKMFGGRFTDMLSGYRVLSRRFVKSFPAISTGFETETELSVHAMELCMPCGEFETPYAERMEGSESKLSTYKDGLKILKMVLRLYASERPLRFFGIIALFLCMVSVIAMVPVWGDFIAHGVVAKIPTVIVASCVMLGAALSLIVGVILKGVTEARKETRYLCYLNVR